MRFIVKLDILMDLYSPMTGENILRTRGLSHFWVRHTDFRQNATS